MTAKKNNSGKVKKPRILSGIEGFGEVEEVVQNVVQKEEKKEPAKRGPKMQTNRDGYRTVQKDKKLIFVVPNYGVEFHIDGKKFTVREFHRLFPNPYKDFNILVDFAKEQVSFHIPYQMAVEHNLYVRQRKEGTFIEYIYDIRTQENEE